MNAPDPSWFFYRYLPTVLGWRSCYLWLEDSNIWIHTVLLSCVSGPRHKLNKIIFILRIPLGELDPASLSQRLFHSPRDGTDRKTSPSSLLYTQAPHSSLQVPSNPIISKGPSRRTGNLESPRVVVPVLLQRSWLVHQSFCGLKYLILILTFLKSLKF